MASQTQEFHPNTFRKHKPLFYLFLVSGFWLLVFSLSGCGPKYTFPANTVPQSVEQLCLKEYNLKVTARVVGKTVGAICYTDSIVDESGQVTKEAYEIAGKVLQSVTRVALSTDLPLEYCMVVLRDKVHQTQVMITRSVDDTKRAYADALGVEESINRTIFGQARIDEETAKSDTFILPDIKLEDFLAQQIVQRIKMNFYKNIKEEAEMPPLVLTDGYFSKTEGNRLFRFSVMALRADNPNEMMTSIFQVVNEVLKGYKFLAFDEVEILDYANRQKLVLPKQVILDYQNKKISDAELLEKYLLRSQSIQDSFKLFGFNLPQDPAEQKEVSLKPAQATP